MKCFKILIINGPNLNLLGTREPEIYGNQNFNDFLLTLQKKFSNCELTYFQTNHEGAIIDKLHYETANSDGIILNAGAYTHTSIAIADAISGINKSVIEVHISNVYKRSLYRHKSYLSQVCKHTIVGHGLSGYEQAINCLLNPTPLKYIGVTVYGKVQGVWFRYTTHKKAISLKINGKIRNEPNGTVSIKAYGSEPNIDTFIKYLHRGPEHAKVSKLELTNLDSFIHDGFEIER